jgi:hypothetical protein
MQTLNISPAFEGLSNLLPVPSPIDLYCLCKLVIFLLRPMAFSGTVLVFSRTGFIQMGIGRLFTQNYLLDFTGQLLNSNKK